jgi:DNA-binding NtrC family response regulator
LILCNLKHYDGNSVAFGKKIKTNYLLIETILLTVYGTIPNDVQAIKNGAFDHITKIVENCKILHLLYKACKKVV